MNKISKIAIANRGEVALRIIKTCKKLGIKSVLLHSDVDEKNTKAYFEADECILIEPHNSYLDIDKVLIGLEKSKADAVHPGFGFLSENASFAKRVEESGFIFIGPNADTISKMGDKTVARELCEKASVPVIPGYNEDVQDSDTLLKAAKQIGFPLLIKASFGGGGRGIRICKSESDFYKNLESARRESEASFNSKKIFLEKYLDRAKHVEFQILGDGKNVVHLYERECSVQRRHQKVVEEAPCPVLNTGLRNKMADCAVKVAKAVGYRSAGTVEFLLFEDNFYFLEMNTRLQVEHPVTEMILDLDLVELQIEIAKTGKLPGKLEKIKPKGHAIECRVYAENDGVPSTGKILHYSFDKSSVRCDDGFDTNHEIVEFYDSMFSKLIVHADTREDCIKKLNIAFANYIVFGIETNLNILRNIINHKTFLDSKASTNFTDYFHIKESKLDERYLEFLIKKEINNLETIDEHRSPFVRNKINPQRILKKSQFVISGKKIDVSYMKSGEGLWIHCVSGNDFLGSWLCKPKDDILLSGEGDNIIKAFMPGKITNISVKKGDKLKAGDVVLVMEAMKMEYVIKVHSNSVICRINIKKDDQVKKGDILVELEPEVI